MVLLTNSSTRGQSKQIHKRCPMATTEEQKQEKGAEPTPAVFDPVKALEQPLKLLQTGNDTHKFVGLALLKSILDNQQILREDHQVIAKCWTAISPRFLDGLLRASQSQSRSRQEAQNMVELAVAIIHVFVVLLPPEKRESAKLVGRTPGLVAALLQRWVPWSRVSLSRSIRLIM